MLSSYLDIWISLDNWIYLDLDVDPGEDVRPAQGALGQVVAALGACAQVPARQQDHAALLLQTHHALGGEEGLDEGGGGGRGLLPLLGGGGGRVLVQVGGGGAGVPALQLVQLGGQALLHGDHLLHADADLAPHVLAAHPELSQILVLHILDFFKCEIFLGKKWNKFLAPTRRQKILHLCV